MRKQLLLGAAFASMLAAPMAHADLVDVNYDFTAWDDNGVLELFLKAAENGRMYPTKAEFEAAGFDMEAEFARSHTRIQPIIGDTKLVSTVNEGRKLWANVPTGQGKDTAGFPSGAFHSDAFTGWNYTAAHGAWNHGWFQVPGSWSAAAHKHGAQIIGGLAFFDNTGGQAGEADKWTAHMQKMATKNADGSFKYLDAMTNAMLYFGVDGVQYNMEAGTCFSSYNATQKDFREFYAQLRKKLASYDCQAFIGAYQPSSMISESNAQYYLGSAEQGSTFDLFLNYAASAYNHSAADDNYEFAKKVGHEDHIWQGTWYNNLNGRGWAEMVNKKINLVIWGEHSVSRMFEFVRGKNAMELQENYQRLQDNCFSGGNRTPLTRPVMSNEGNTFEIADASMVPEQLKTWGGIASMVPERSSIKQNLPFNTYFSVGNGEFYFYKGKKTNGSWYNMGQQDYVPTYRWLVTPVNDMTQSSTAVDVYFSHKDAYVGGNALRIENNSENAASADIVLYRAELTAKDAVKATLAVKTGVADANDSHLKLILRKKGATNWIEVPYGQVAGKTWEEKTLNVAGLAADDVIDHIGLRVEGMPAKSGLYVGQINLNDGSTVACASIDASSLKTDLKEEFTNVATVRMVWDMNSTGFNTPAKERGMVFNDEINVDHFEVFYRFGENGTPCEVGRTNTWHAMIPGLDLSKATGDVYVGVRAVSTDLKSASAVVWQQIVRNPNAETKFVDPDGYGFSYIDQGSDNWQTGCQTRWYEEVKTTGATQNLDYTQTKQGPFPTDRMPGYILAEQTLKVAPGEKVTFHVRGHYGNDDIKYCITKAYMDFDCNADFTGDDEQIFEIGQLNHGAAYPNGAGNRDMFVTTGFDIEVTIPADVVPGTSRLRLVASDAWKSHPGATGGTAKGHSLDFPVQIIDKGQTTRPVTETYYSLQDEGVADNPLNSGINDIVLPDTGANMQVYPTVTSDVLNFVDVEKAWIYSINGQMVKYVSNAADATSVAGLANGMYIVKMQNGQVVRSQKIIKK